MKQAGFPGFAAVPLKEDERIKFLFSKVGTDKASPINVKTQIRGLYEMKRGGNQKANLSGPVLRSKCCYQLSN